MPVHLVLPSNVDDPSQPSGGNRYDRRVSDALRAAGVDVREHAIVGDWPAPDARATNALAAVVADLPDGAAVLIDGLIASAMPAATNAIMSGCHPDRKPPISKMTYIGTMW